MVFSPHPDDDVISMGGVLRKLVENQNHITVAYQTSGNIAVFDHEVRRYLDFVRRWSTSFGDWEAEVLARAESAQRYLSSKVAGDVDEPEILDLKRYIRETEAVSALEMVGLSSENAVFLNLPFYQTGKVTKDPIGQGDVDRVRAVR